MSTARAQDCSIPFTTPMFGVRQEMDVYYGTVPRYNGVMQDLRLNLFKPVGDGQTERPLIILIHGGGFFDGDRNDLNDLCGQLASMGWAAATISYRLDFYGTWLLGSPWTYDAAEVIRAAYRAQQDTRGAVRFLKARHAQDSTSTQNVMLMGFSAGAIAALHAAYVDEPAEKPAACGAIGDVVHLFTHYPRPDLGPIGGQVSVNGMSDEVLGLASFYGGLLDTNFISSPLDPALYTYHQTGDPVVGCGYQQGLWGMPLGVNANYPYLYGSCVIDTRVQHLDPAPGRYQYHPFLGDTHGVDDPDTVYPEAFTFLKELFCPATSGALVACRVMLDGPYDPGTGLMNDPLRVLPGFPLTEPYSALGYVHAGGGGGEGINSTVLATEGADAIVDWVVLEVRGVLQPEAIISTRSALVQRDGDVVDVDGVSPVTFVIPAGMYHVAVRHRNHLGVMSAAPVALGGVPAVVDFSSIATGTFGTEARKTVSGAFPAEVLWGGDIGFDGLLKYTGTGNDRDPILTTVGSTTPNNTLSGTYSTRDVNMNGQVRYTGAGNDRDPILVNVGSTTPNNVRVEQLP